MEAADPAGYWAAFYVLAVEQYRDNFGAAIAAVADAPDGVVLFHCTGGKDRTGLIAALLLRLAGATIGDVAADYALSEASIPTGPGSWIEAAPTEDERRRRRFKQQTPAAAMAITLETLDERYGDVGGYLRGAGVSEEQLARLRDRLAAP
jgi:protein-tyrosine phosphatase